MRTKPNPYLRVKYLCPNPDCKSAPVYTMPVNYAIYRGQRWTSPCLTFDAFWKLLFGGLTTLLIIGGVLALVVARVIDLPVWMAAQNVIALTLFAGAGLLVLVFLHYYALSPKMQNQYHRCRRCHYAWEEPSSPIETIDQWVEGEMKRATKRGRKQETAAILVTSCFLASREKNWELVESNARMILKLCDETTRNKITESVTAHAHTYLGLAALYRGQYPQAAPHFEVSLAQGRKAKDWSKIAYSLDNLALARLYQGIADGIAAMLSESLALVATMQDRRELPWAFEATAALAALQDQPERAARLYGASRALRNTHSAFSLPLDDCAGFSQSVATTRKRLGDARYEEAWQAGYAMPLDDAIAFCKRGYEPRADPPAAAAGSSF